MHNENGIPILTLDEKLEALRYCIECKQEEDAVGHIFDLLNLVAPGYRLGLANGVQKLAEVYGTKPVKVIVE